MFTSCAAAPRPDGSALLDVLIKVSMLRGFSRPLLQMLADYLLVPFPGSALLDTERLQHMMHSLHARPAARWRLLYSSARDGLSHHQWLRCVGPHPRTLTMARTRDGSLCGGFASVRWDSIYAPRTDSVLPWLQPPDVNPSLGMTALDKWSFQGCADPEAYVFTLKQAHSEIARKMHAPIAAGASRGRLACVRRSLVELQLCLVQSLQHQYAAGPGGGGAARRNQLLFARG